MEKEKNKKKEPKCAFDEKRICKEDCVARTLEPGGNWYAPYCSRGKFYL